MFGRGRIILTKRFFHKREGGFALIGLLETEIHPRLLGVLHFLDLIVVSPIAWRHFFDGSLEGFGGVLGEARRGKGAERQGRCKDQRGIFQIEFHVFVSYFCMLSAE